MASLYVTSLSAGAGRTAVAASVVSLLGRQGRKAAYVKPLTIAEGAKQGADGDAAFCKAALGLAEDLSAIGPTVVEPSAVVGGLGALAGPLKQRLSQVAAGKDTLVIDGVPAAGPMAAASAELAGLADANVVAVLRYRRGLDLDAVTDLKGCFGARFLGVIFNAAPATGLRLAREETARKLEGEGVRVLGVIPEERLLLGFTVAEYEARLGGRIVNNQESSGEIVESILIGAMALDPGEYYYERRRNKALVTRGDRPDLQWSALDTSTRCLILTQNIEPIAYVLNKAMEASVPMVVVPKGTLDTVAAIESFVAMPTFHHPDKLARFAELLGERVGLAALGL